MRHRSQTPEQRRLYYRAHREAILAANKRSRRKHGHRWKKRSRSRCDDCDSSAYRFHRCLQPGTKRTVILRCDRCHREAMRERMAWKLEALDELGWKEGAVRYNLLGKLHLFRVSEEVVLAAVDSWTPFDECVNKEWAEAAHTALSPQRFQILELHWLGASLAEIAQKRGLKSREHVRHLIGQSLGWVWRIGRELDQRAELETLAKQAGLKVARRFGI